MRQPPIHGRPSLCFAYRLAKLGIATLVFAILCATGSVGHAQQILLLHDTKVLSTDEAQLRSLIDFLGVPLQSLAITSTDSTPLIKSLQSDSNTLAILTPASLLPYLDRRMMVRGGHRGGRPIPIMVYGIAPDVSDYQLVRWSSGALHRCFASPTEETSGSITVSQNLLLNRNLAGLQLPQVIAPTCRLAGDQAFKGQALLVTAGGEPAPLLYQTSANGQEIFFVPQVRRLRQDWVGKPSSLAEAFSSVAPFLLFLRHVSRDFAWHLDGHYANFTVDDPWLVQPYGNLDYKSLLLAMEAHHFHTTIAFVPWNYDRSRPDVVRLFHDHSSLYSLCMHGNNHAHREFGDYTQRSLERQVADLTQGIERMNRLHSLTGLDYDRVMVFPHAVAPESTFAALQTRSYLATANSSNVPLDRPFPADPLFLLKSYSTAYGNLLSLSRYSVEAPIPALDVAIQNFLGNPLLFYAHQTFFAGGAGAFNPTADLVNHMNPNLQWVSLGDLSRHLYEMRRRADGNTDIRMLSREMTLRPSSQRRATYVVSYVSPPSNSVTSVVVDGMPIPYQQTGSGIQFHLPASPSRTRNVYLCFRSDTEVTGVEIKKHDLRVAFIRASSDVRDRYLSRLPVGRALIDAYYRHQGEARERYVENHWYLLLAFTGLGWGALRFRRHRRPDRSSSVAIPLEHTPS